MVATPLYFADKFVNKKFEGTLENSLLGKFANVGDRISEKLHLNNIVSEQNSQKISDAISQNRFTKYFTDNFKAVPKCPFAKGESLTEKFVNAAANNLKNLNKEKAPEGIKKFFNSSNGYFKQETLDFIQNGKGSFKDVADDLISGIDKILAEDAAKSGKDSLLQGKSSLSGINNKLKTVTNKAGKTALGNKFAKGLIKSKDTLTMGGGIFGIGFAANALVNAVKAAKEAPEGEKTSTFMHV